MTRPSLPQRVMCLKCSKLLFAFISFFYLLAIAIIWSLAFALSLKLLFSFLLILSNMVYLWQETRGSKAMTKLVYQGVDGSYLLHFINGEVVYLNFFKDSFYSLNLLILNMKREDTDKHISLCLCFDNFCEPSDFHFLRLQMMYAQGG